MEVAHVGSISNIHINAAKAKMATVLCSTTDRRGEPLAVIQKKVRGTNQKNRNTAIAAIIITIFLTGNFPLKADFVSDISFIF